MKYERPQVIDAGMAEGVYMASGDCDCFTIQAISENTATSGIYWLYYEIYRNADHEHSVDEDWANLHVEIVFNMDIPATVTLVAGEGTISGNTLIIPKETIIPSADDCSYEGIRMTGEGAEQLRYVSIRAVHN